MIFLTNMNDPGFVDTHVHIKNFEALASVATAGIIAVRDAGMRHSVSREAFTRCRRDCLLTIVYAGWALYKRGGYGSLFGVGVETREEMKSEILKLKRAGAGIIKVMASGAVSLKEPGVVTPGGFNRDELYHIVKESATVELRVMAHANGEAAIISAVEAGVCSIEHGFFMTERALDAMTKQGTYWTPTVGALARAAESGSVSKEMREYGAGLIRSHLDMIHKAHRIGTRLAVGTDCVLPEPGYQEAYHAELSYFERAGISPEAVMKIACEGGRKLLEL